MKAGIICRIGSAWLGVHYSKMNKRWCINILPCVTIWVAGKEGKVPHKNKM